VVRTLVHTARRIKKEGGGQYLPPVFNAFEQRSIRARMGTVTYIMGPPGAFKTGFAMYYVGRLGLPTLYNSADAEDFETVERAAAMVSGVPMSVIEQDYSRYASELSELDHIRFCYDDSPTYDDLGLEVAAYAEVYGDFPKVIVIDTLMKVTGETDDEWAAMRDTSKVVHYIARTTGAAVLVLHHAADDTSDNSRPKSRNKMQGKVSQIPKAIWSLALNGDELYVAQVKSKWGPEDTSGHNYATLYVDAATNRIFQSRYDLQQGRAA
jgi:hypothetical protein